MTFGNKKVRKNKARMRGLDKSPQAVLAARGEKGGHTGHDDAGDNEEQGALEKFFHEYLPPGVKKKRIQCAF